MIRKDYVRYYAPIVFFLLLLIDGQLTNSILILTDNAYFASVNLLLLAFLLTTTTLSRKYLVISAIIIGLIADSYYLGIIGIYTVALSSTVSLGCVFSDILHTNLVTEFFGMIIFTTIYELIVISLQIVFNLSDVYPLLFITKVLGPTLLFNMLFFVLCVYPLKKLFPTK